MVLFLSSYFPYTFCIVHYFYHALYHFNTIYYKMYWWDWVDKIITVVCTCTVYTMLFFSNFHLLVNRKWSYIKQFACDYEQNQTQHHRTVSRFIRFKINTETFEWTSVTKTFLIKDFSQSHMMLSYKRYFFLIVNTAKAFITRMVGKKNGKHIMIQTGVI